MTLAGHTVKVIVGFDQERAIGKGGSLPWRLPEDLKRFSKLTKGRAVLMGRATWDSLPEKFRPLPERLNIILSTSITELAGALVIDSIETLVEILSAEGTELPDNEIWIIGGAKVYEATMSFWDEVYVTHVVGSHQGDTFFPPFEAAFDAGEPESHDGFSFVTYLRKS